MINDKYPRASSFVQWALERSKATFDPNPVAYEGRYYQVTFRAWSGNIGNKAASIYREVGNGRVHLVNDELRQLWVENSARYSSEYGALSVGEALYKLARCGRCNEVLDDENSAKVNSCEDCITAVMEDPDAELDAWCRGEWAL
jgi:hypothetical protein